MLSRISFLPKYLIDKKFILEYIIMYSNIMVNKNEKIEAGIMLASYLDTIGFKNGNWEFNYRLRIRTILEAILANFQIVHHYMSLGGFNNLDIKNWKASDDTLLIMATIKALNDGASEINFTKRYIEIYDELVKEERISGYQTLKSIDFLKKITKSGKKASYLEMIPYDKNMGGNGAAIRTGPIGVYFANDFDKLIDTSIMASRLTHNIPIGYLGGFISALFTSYAFNNIQPWLWIDKLLDLVKSNKIYNYIHSTDIGNKDDNEIQKYFFKWYQYKETRFNDLINFRGKSQFIFPNERFIALSEYVSKYKQEEPKFNFGSSGLDSVIFAYDSLLMSITPNERFEIDFDNPKYNAESFLFFSTLHCGDSDSTGAIAGYWYGTLLGYNGFDPNKMKKLEFYNQLKKLSDNFSKK
jgi:ADP-ribosylarginine hydrolase